MTFSVKTYSPNDLILNVAGYQVTGWNTITVSNSTPDFQLVKGCRGYNTRIRNPDTSLTISVELMQSSSSNDVFSEIVRLDRLYNTGKLEVTLTDLNSKTFISTFNAFIESYPQSTFTETLGTRVWNIVCLNTEERGIQGSNFSPLDLFNDVRESTGKIVNNVTESVSNLFN